ncbi:MAG TPA: hypothetical protein VMG82_00455 [Candidatus Sulfotelmatobacter sp.]|nr:hypothetical protein [Candidatus Sulfotelmatobacter sp.]
MPAFANVMHLFAYKFSRLRTGRFPFPCILAFALDRFSLRHKISSAAAWTNTGVREIRDFL